MAERNVVVNLRFDVSAFVASMARATAGLRRLGAAIEKFRHRYRKPSRSSTVPPLCIDGHAYRRRRQARRRR